MLPVHHNIAVNTSLLLLGTFVGNIMSAMNIHISIMFNLFIIYKALMGTVLSIHKI